MGKILVDFCPGCDGAFKTLGKDYPFEAVNFVTRAGRAMGIEHEHKPAPSIWKGGKRTV